MAWYPEARCDVARHTVLRCVALHTVAWRNAARRRAWRSGAVYYGAVLCATAWRSAPHCGTCCATACCGRGGIAAREEARCGGGSREEEACAACLALLVGLRPASVGLRPASAGLRPACGRLRPAGIRLVAGSWGGPRQSKFDAARRRAWRSGAVYYGACATVAESIICFFVFLDDPEESKQNINDRTH